jgi:hypothetical protein
MTLPKKGSRIIRVDDVQYRWTVSRQAFDNNQVRLTFLAHEERPARNPFQQLFTRTPPLPKLSVAFYESHCNVVTPSIAISFIRGGLEAGWDPRGTDDYFIKGHAATRLLCL